jgi:ribose-phosphate pyrophosphokinase
MSGAAFEKINNSVLTEIAVSDTIPLQQESPKMKVLTVAELFSKAIRNVHDHESISSLFIKI